MSDLLKKYTESCPLRAPESANKFRGFEEFEGFESDCHISDHVVSNHVVFSHSGVDQNGLNQVDFNDDFDSDDAFEQSGERLALGTLGNILLVEADPDQQWQLARMLSGAGARVVGTSSGDGALALVREWPVDVLLVAENLPGMDGFSVCRRILELRPGVRIVMIADSWSTEDRMRADAAGASNCVARPLDLPALGLLLAVGEFAAAESVS